MSTMMIVVAPAALAAIIPAIPTAPVPKIATEEPGVGFSTFSTAPEPVMMPQPSGPRMSSGTSLGTFTAPRAGTLVNSANEDWPKKCEPTGPFSSEKALGAEVLVVEAHAVHGVPGHALFAVAAVGRADHDLVPHAESLNVISDGFNDA